MYGDTVHEREARMSTIELTVVTPDALGVVPAPPLAARPHARRGRERPRLGRGHRAALAIVVAPIALLGVAAWLGQRLYRRREDERLLAQS